MRPRWAILAAFALLTAGFAYGFQSHRAHWFPFDLLRMVLEETGLAGRPTVNLPANPPAHLDALGYLSALPDRDNGRSGVVRLDEQRAQPGYSLYSTTQGREARLISLSGEVVHQWKAETEGAWYSVTLIDNGDLLILQPEGGLLRMDRDSRVQWRLPGRFHHDLDVFDDRIYALSRRDTASTPALPKRWRTLVDMVTVLDLEGLALDEIDILAALEASPFAFLIPRVPSSFSAVDGAEIDILHLNHVEVIDHEREGSPLRRGHILLSSRHLNAIFTLDPQTHEISWMWGPGFLTRQHHPRLLDNGNLLIFDNGVETSRVIELDPATFDIVWTYSDGEFFSRYRGSVQRLANGNTLITESDRGRVLEVTVEGDTVWTFLAPDLSPEGERGVIWRMERFSPESLTSWLDAGTR